MYTGERDLKEVIFYHSIRVYIQVVCRNAKEVLR